MGRYKSAADTRREGEKRTAGIKLAAVVLILTGFVAAYLIAMGDRRTLDKDTLCPSSPDAVTTLLVDVTDPMNIAQRQDLVNQLERLRTSIPRYGKLTIFKVDASSERLLTPVIERCNPGTADDVSRWNDNPTATAKRYKEEFIAPLDQAFTSILSASGAERSPILESVQAIALTKLKAKDADNKPKRLIIVSDLLQHTDRMSFYGRLPSPKEAINSDAFRLARTDLKDVDTELWMLQRLDARQSQPLALIRLWEAMIQSMGGSVTRSYTVSG